MGREYLVNGEWLPKPEADRRMMYQALERIAQDGVTMEQVREIAFDTLGFVGDVGVWPLSRPKQPEDA